MKNFKSAALYSPSGKIRQVMNSYGEYKQISSMSESHIVNLMAHWQERLSKLYLLKQWNDAPQIKEVIKDVEKAVTACNEYLNKIAEDYD